MNDASFVLQPGEFIIESSPELIFRQITKHLIKGNQIGSPAFVSSPDNGTPSYSRSSIVTAQQSRDWHTANAKSPSLAVCALAVEDVASLDINVIDDSSRPLATEEIRAPGHCFVDCRNLSKMEMTNLRGNLLRFAHKHGFIPTFSADHVPELDLEFP